MLRNILFAASKADSGKTTLAAATLWQLQELGYPRIRAMECEERPRLGPRVNIPVQFHALAARRGEEDVEYKHYDPIAEAMGGDQTTLIDSAGGQIGPIIDHILDHHLERTTKQGARLLVVWPVTIQEDSRRGLLSNLPVIRAALQRARICVILHELKGRFSRGNEPRWPDFDKALEAERKGAAGLIEIYTVPGLELAPKVADEIAAAPLSKAIRLTDLNVLAGLGLTSATADRQAAVVEEFLDVHGKVAREILSFAELPEGSAQ